MKKKSLHDLQYENAKIDNDVNTGCAIVTLVCLAAITVFTLGLILLALA